MKNFIAYTLILFGIGLICSVFYIRSQVGQQTRSFSVYSVLSSSWEKYKEQFINNDGRVIDYSQKSITTSEGQSYALLRAVWMNDKKGFDLIWKWTKENMQKRDDKLFGWKWGKLKNGSFGFLEDGGKNSASDADQDIALALIFAGHRWKDQKYLDEAKAILTDLWEKETVVINGKRYLIAGNWAQNETEIVINPSYFAPYAWRIFAQLDHEHDWESLINPSYDLLTRSSQVPLDKNAGKLPPDWLKMNKESGAIAATSLDGLTTNYSYDAMRIPWRIALDFTWNKEPQARKYLLDSFGIFSDWYKQEKSLPTTIEHDGKVIDNNETPVMYATALGYFLVADRKTADKIYQDKIIRLYSNDTNSFKQNLAYYEQNWLWFSVGLYNNFLKPL